MSIFSMCPRLSTVLLLQGLPGSGKSHRAAAWLAEDSANRFRLSYDDLRIQLYGTGWKWNRDEEARMKAVAQGQVIEALKAGKSVIIDNTNLSGNVREMWKHIAELYGASFVMETMTTSVEECCRRDKQRDGQARVGRAVIERMALFNGLIDWDDRTIYPRDLLLCDIDGTIADLKHRKHFIERNCTICASPAEKSGDRYHCSNALCGSTSITKKDWMKFFAAVSEDTPIQPIIDLVKLLSEKYEVAIVSGRASDQCGKATEEWLDRHEVPYRHLLMRSGGDGREDVIVKREILERLPKNRIKLVLDDRSSVVAMWRAAGLTCLQCAPGDF